MNSLVVVALLSALLSLHVSAFTIHKKVRGNSRVVANVVGNSRRELDRGLNEVDKGTTDDMIKAESTLMTLMYTPPVIDPIATFWLAGTEIFVLNIALVLGQLFRIDTTKIFFITPSGLQLSVGFAIVMSLIGFITDQLPIDFFRRTARDMKFLFGRDSNNLNVLAVSGLVSWVSGFAEEVLFRGLIFQGIYASFGLIPAYVTSSALFGLAHYPIFGANAFLESMLGGIFSFLYYYSGFNLAVPVICHALYDWATLYITWLNSKSLLLKTMQELEAKEVKFPQVTMSYDTDSAGQTRFYFLRAIFDLVDMNQDGEIDDKELVLALRLLGYGDVRPFLYHNEKQILNSKQTFDNFDSDRNGLISFSEFVNAISECEMYSEFEKQKVVNK